MKKNRCMATIFIISITLILMADAAAAETFDRGEIRFKRGSSSGTVTGAVLRGDSDRYSLGAGAGQWMEVRISSPEKNAVFALSVYEWGTDRDVALKNAKEGDDARYWYGKLPKPGFSKDGKQNIVDITVGGTRGNASYDLTVTIKNGNWLQKK